MVSSSINSLTLASLFRILTGDCSAKVKEFIDEDTRW
jgi:hypothetical protein